MLKERTQLSERSFECTVCGGETIQQENVNFLQWCEIPDGHNTCLYCKKCGNIFQQPSEELNQLSSSHSES